MSSLESNPGSLALGSAGRRGLNWATETNRRAAVLLTILSLLAFLPGLFSIPPIDRDEARYAQASRQMIETGNFVDIRFQDEPRYNKPIGIYWLQALAATASGRGSEASIGVFRIPSLLGATAAVLLTYWAGLALFSRRAAFVAAIALASSLLLTVEAHQAKTDSFLLATTVLAMGGLAHIYFGDGKKAPARAVAAFWGGLGLGILIKGPIILMVVGLAIVALVVIDRRVVWLRRSHPAIGIPVLLLIVLPWFVAIWSVAGSDFFSQSLGGDLIAKLGSGQEGHAAPPGSYLAVGWLTFWPASFLAIAAIPWIWRHRRDPRIRFCLAWLVPSWIVIELVATKLPHYPLPLYPAIALLAGGAVAAGGVAADGRWTKVLTVLAAVLAILASVGAAAGLISANGLTGAGVAACLLALVAVGLGGVAALAAIRGQLLPAWQGLLAAAVVFYGLSFGVVVPRLDGAFASARAAEAASAAAACGPAEVVAAGFEEPSLVFLVGTSLRFADGAGAANVLAESDCGVALVEQALLAAFLTEAAVLGLRVEKAGMVEGISLGEPGRRVVIDVYRIADEEA